MYSVPNIERKCNKQQRTAKRIVLHQLIHRRKCFQASHRIQNLASQAKHSLSLALKFIAEDLHLALPLGHSIYTYIVGTTAVRLGVAIITWCPSYLEIVDAFLPQLLRRQGFSQLDTFIAVKRCYLLPIRFSSSLPSSLASSSRSFTNVLYRRCSWMINSYRQSDGHNQQLRLCAVHLQRTLTFFIRAFVPATWCSLDLMFSMSSISARIISTARTNTMSEEA